MKSGQKVLIYATGFVLGCLILAVIPREDAKPKRHPWHEQTALDGMFPMELVDDMERTVKLEKQPRHIISLAPSVTEIVYAMGLGDHLIAVTQWCTFPEEAKALRDAGAHVGSMDQPNRETIAAYRPDLIIGTDLTPPEIYSAIENPPGTVAMVLSHDSMEDVRADVALIGTAMGVPGMALKLNNRLKSEQQAVDFLVQSHSNEPAKRVLFLLSIEQSGQPGWTPGEGTWVHDLLISANCINVASELGTSWGEVSYESLLRLNPEILLVRDGEDEAASKRLQEKLATLESHPVWKQVQAVKDGRIHVIAHGPMNIPGPRMTEAYRLVAEAVWSAQSGQ